MGAATAAAAGALELARLVVKGSDADQGGGLAAADGAELGHVGAQAGGVEGAEAGDRANDRDAAGEGLVGVEGGLDLGVEPADLGDEGLHDGGAQLVAVDFRAQLAQGVAVLDELAAEGEQVAEKAQVVGRGRGGLQAVKQAVAGQHGGVDLVVLGAAAEGLGEAPGVQRVGEHGLEAGVEEALVQAAVVAAGGLEDDTRDAQAQQPHLSLAKLRCLSRGSTWASREDLPTSMPATTGVTVGVGIPAFLSFAVTETAVFASVVVTRSFWWFEDRAVSSAARMRPVSRVVSLVTRKEEAGTASGPPRPRRWAHQILEETRRFVCHANSSWSSGRRCIARKTGHAGHAEQATLSSRNLSRWPLPPRCCGRESASVRAGLA